MMNEVVRLVADEDFDNDIVRGLILRRPGVLLVRVQDLFVVRHQVPGASPRSSSVACHRLITWPTCQADTKPPGLRWTAVDISGWTLIQSVRQYETYRSVVSMLTNQQTAAMFKALGDPTRLHIFEFLCRCCCQVAVEETGDVRPVTGATAGAVCCHVTGGAKITSSISFHLKELRQAGLIVMERRGKNRICSVSPNAIKELAEYFARQQEGETTSVCCP